MSKTLAERLLPLLPEEWGCHLRDNNGMIWFRSGVNPCQCDINLSGEEESLGFINWALDELAKADGVVIVNLGWTDYGWTVTVMFTPSDERETLTVTPKETKTLALAHALVEVARG